MSHPKKDKHGSMRSQSSIARNPHSIPASLWQQPFEIDESISEVKSYYSRALNAYTNLKNHAVMHSSMVHKWKHAPAILFTDTAHYDCSWHSNLSCRRCGIIKHAIWNLPAAEQRSDIHRQPRITCNDNNNKLKIKYIHTAYNHIQHGLWTPNKC